jgi:oxaloacetate decarboxylase
MQAARRKRQTIRLMGWSIMLISDGPKASRPAMNFTERRKRLRALLSGTRCIYPGSVYDALSARIAEDLGFEAGMFAGSIASLAVLGAPDLVVLTLTEFAEQARRICRAGSLPLIVDADHGYGNALNVRRTVEELENAGVAALTIEDTLLPAPFGGGKEQLIATAEAVGKMRAAISARNDRDTIVVGRTSALPFAGIEEAIERGKAYQAAGVDAIFFVGMKSRAQLDAIAPAVDLPIFLGSVGPELMDLDYLSGRGVRVCLQGHQPFLAALRAVHETLRALREGVAPGEIAGVAPAELLKRATREDDYRRWMREYLGG